MTSPQQRPETMEPTDRTGASAQNLDEATGVGPASDASYATERTGASAENLDAARAAGPSAEKRPVAEGAGVPEGAGPTPETTGSAGDSSTMGTQSSARRTGTSFGESLFAEPEHSSLRSRWADIQAGFVDDPRGCVHKADGLVADLVDELTAGFAEARARLEEHWARGEEVSTENLRVALKRYRDFFERLLAV